MTLKQTNIRIDPALLDALNVVKARDGVPVSEQIRRAIAQWLDAKGVLVGDAAPKPRRKGARR